MTRDFNTVEINATTLYAGSAGYDWSKPQAVSLSITFETVEQQNAFLAQFPKSHKWSRSTVSTADGEFPFSATRADLRKTGVHGEKNETGIKRYYAIMQKLESAGIAYEWRTGYANSYADRESFEAAL
jgi:hypothetical protein